MRIQSRKVWKRWLAGLIPLAVLLAIGGWGGWLDVKFFFGVSLGMLALIAGVGILLFAALSLINWLIEGFLRLSLYNHRRDVPASRGAPRVVRRVFAR